MSSCCGEVQHCTGTCLETNHNSLFFFFSPPHRRAQQQQQSGGERSLCWRAQESRFSSPRQCTTTPSASHANKKLWQTISYLHLSPNEHAGGNKRYDHLTSHHFFFSFLSFLKNVQQKKKLADEEKVIKGYLYGERLQVKENASAATKCIVWFCSSANGGKKNKNSRLDLIKTKIFALLTSIQRRKNTDLMTANDNIPE